MTSRLAKLAGVERRSRDRGLAALAGLARGIPGEAGTILFVAARNDLERATR